MKIPNFVHWFVCLLVVMLGIFSFSGIKGETGIAIAKETADTDIYLPVVLNFPGMVYVPAGEFQMGCDNNDPSNFCYFKDVSPMHTVYLSAYYIDVYEVTSDQYAAFLNLQGDNDCGGSQCMDVDHGESNIIYQGDQYIARSGYSDHPVNAMSWYGANAYCVANGKRLPSEAEWEKAARGSNDTRIFPWGDEPPNCTLANARYYNGTKWTYCHYGTTPVGSYPAGASPYGVLDMAGNVSEWVNDWYDSDYYTISPVVNPTGPITGTSKIKRANDWNNAGLYQKVFYRAESLPTSVYFTNGFRCAAAPGK